MWALLTLRLVFFLDDEARICFPGFVSITRDPEHSVRMGRVGATLISKDDELGGLADNVTIIFVEISSNFMFVILTDNNGCNFGLMTDILR